MSEKLKMAYGLVLEQNYESSTLELAVVRADGHEMPALGERVVVIAEAEYEAMKALNDAIKVVGDTGEALITTRSKYYAMERFIDAQGFEVDGWGNVVMKNAK